jgi:hypothetical protein
MKETTEILAMLRNSLAALGLIAKGAESPALAFLIGMAELEAAQAELKAKRKALRKK